MNDLEKVIYSMLALSLTGCAVHINLKSKYVEASLSQETPPIKSYDKSSGKLDDKSLEEMLESVERLNVDAKIKATVYDSSGTVLNRNITTLTGLGSGIVLEGDKSYYLLTCAHVADSFKKAGNLNIGINNSEHTRVDYDIIERKTYLHSKNSLDIKLLDSDSSKDLALLELPKSPLVIPARMPFAEYNSIKRGDSLYAVGFPSSFGKTVTNGIVSNPDDLAGDKDRFLGSTPINGGNSGGPVYVIKNGKPHIAGLSVVTYRGMQGTHGFIKISTIEQYLKERGFNDILKRYR